MLVEVKEQTKIGALEYIEVQDQVKNGRPHEKKLCHATLKFITNVLTVLWYFKRWQNWHLAKID